MLDEHNRLSERCNSSLNFVRRRSLLPALNRGADSASPMFPTWMANRFVDGGGGPDNEGTGGCRRWCHDSPAPEKRKRVTKRRQRINPAFSATASRNLSLTKADPQRQFRRHVGVCPNRYEKNVNSLG